MKRGETVSVSEKIKALIKLKGKKSYELAEYLGLASAQALHNKFNRDSFSAADLIKIADFLGCDLNFGVDDKQKISLTLADLKSSKVEEI